LKRPRSSGGAGRAGVTPSVERGPISSPRGFNRPLRRSPLEGGRAEQGGKPMLARPPGKRAPAGEGSDPQRKAQEGDRGREDGREREGEPAPPRPPPQNPPALRSAPPREAPPGELNFPGGEHARDLRRFPLNNFKFFELSFQSSLHLSLTVLVRYRASSPVFSFGWGLPPGFGLRSQAARLAEKRGPPRGLRGGPATAVRAARSGSTNGVLTLHDALPQRTWPPGGRERCAFPRPQLGGPAPFRHLPFAGPRFRA